MATKGPDAPKGGRPREYDREFFAAKFETYIEQNDIPIIGEFCAQYGLYDELLRTWPEFFSLLKKCTTKKAAGLERQALGGKVNVSMAIFSLKQLGWSDKPKDDTPDDAIVDPNPDV